jgi:hypothetical protein
VAAPRFSEGVTPYTLGRESWRAAAVRPSRASVSAGPGGISRPPPALPSRGWLASNPEYSPWPTTGLRDGMDLQSRATGGSKNRVKCLLRERVVQRIEGSDFVLREGVWLAVGQGGRREPQRELCLGVVPAIILAPTFGISETNPRSRNL